MPTSAASTALSGLNDPRAKAAALPTTTGAIAIGRVRGRAPWIHWAAVATYVLSFAGVLLVMLLGRGRLSGGGLEHPGHGEPVRLAVGQQRQFLQDQDGPRCRCRSEFGAHRVPDPFRRCPADDGAGHPGAPLGVF